MSLKSTPTEAVAIAGTAQEIHLVRGFGLWGVISISWNMVNIFGGMSMIFVVGFSAGGIPSIFYGLYFATHLGLCKADMRTAASVLQSAFCVSSSLLQNVPLSFQQQAGHTILPRSSLQLNIADTLVIPLAGSTTSVGSLPLQLAPLLVLVLHFLLLICAT